MKKNKGFTLVELIVVIVILAVLAVISFMIVTKWINKSSNARAASDVGIITRALHGHYSEKGDYPETSKPIGILSTTGLLLGEQGVFAEEVIKSLGTFSKLPKDPQANDYYMYTVIKNPAKGFEVGAVFENPEISVLGAKVYADGVGNSIPYVQSTYHGKYYAIDGVTPIFPKPLSVFDQSTGKYLQKSTIGENGVLVINLGTLTGSQLPSFKADGVQIGGEFGDYISPKLGYVSSGADGSFSTGVIMQALPQTITLIVTSSSSSSSSSIVSNSCASQPSITNATFTTGTPSSVNQMWTYSDTPGNCTWKCESGYQKDTGDACIVSVPTCGSANGTTVATSPAANLCATGTPSVVNYSTGMGDYTWSCIGATTVNCKAYDNYTKLLIHANGLNGTTSFIDNFSHTITTNGSAQISTAKSVFGSSSIYFNGSSYLTLADSDDRSFGNQDFTIDFRIYWTSVTSSNFVSQWKEASYPAECSFNFLYQSNTLQFAYSNGSTYYAFTPGWTPTANTWYHIAVVRKGTVIKIYVNGNQVGSDHNVGSISFTNVSRNLEIGYLTFIGSYQFPGYIDELRISKGIARRTGTTFSVPSQEY